MYKKYPFLEKVAKTAIDEAKKESAEIFMMVDWFQTPQEALHLMDMLWYARDNGVVIRFIPNDLWKNA